VGPCVGELVYKDQTSARRSRVRWLDFGPKRPIVAWTRWNRPDLTTERQTHPGLLPAASTLPQSLTGFCRCVPSFPSQHGLDYCLNLTTF